MGKWNAHAIWMTTVTVTIAVLTTVFGVVPLIGGQGARQEAVTAAHRTLAPSWPAWDWTGSDLQPGTRIRTRHVRDLRQAVEHLLGRDLQSRNPTSRCSESIARYLVGAPAIHDYVENDLMPQADWSDENAEIHRRRIQQEDRIREDCLGGAPSG